MFVEALMRNARVLLALLVSALMGALIVAAATAEPANVAGQVVAVAGPVTVTRAHVKSQPAKFRDLLYWRDVVEARQGGIARALLGGNTTVTVRELSRLELRAEVLAEGIRYSTELASGKIRASVARMLMRPGDQVEVRTLNAVAAVRGTDFIVETVALPSQRPVFGPLGPPEIAQAVANGGSRMVETIVVTLSGVVNVSNRLGGTGRVVQVGAYEAVRVSGNQDPVRFPVSAKEIHVYLKGLTIPRPSEVRSGDKAEAVAKTVEKLALAETSARRAAIPLEHIQPPVTVAVPATPATPASPAVPAMPGVTVATPAVPATPATPATPAMAATPGAWVGNAPAAPFATPPASAPLTPPISARPTVPPVPTPPR